jgi:hypothetical protein
MAKHHKTIRAAVARYAERYRAAQLRAITAALEASSVPAEQLPPVVALLLMTGLSQVLSLEEVLGISAGHKETVAYVRALIDRLEPDDRATGGGAPR